MGFDSPQTDVGIVQLTKLVHGSIATLFAFRHHPHPHRDPDDEVFHQPTIIFTTHGSWRFQSLRENASIQSGVVVLGRTGQHYRCDHTEVIPQDRHLSLSFNELMVRDLMSRYPPEARSRALEAVAFPCTVISRPTMAITQRQRSLLTEVTNRAPGSCLKVDLLAMDLLVEIFRTFGDAPEDPSLQERRLGRRVDAARDYMTSHISEAIDLATLARVAGLSPYHFGRVFKAHVGLAPHQFMIRLRIERAARLLKSSSLSVTQICYEAGFRSLSHFITTFRKHTGVSPSRYRSA